MNASVRFRLAGLMNICLVVVIKHSFLEKVDWLQLHIVVWLLLLVGSSCAWLAESVADTRKNNTICFARQRHSCSCPDWIGKNCHLCSPYCTESPVHKTGLWHVVMMWQL